MLLIDIPLEPEQYDESKNIFIAPKKVKTLRLEHSLVSLSKWESKWHKPFLSKQEKTFEETIDYIKCMTLTQNVSPEVYNHLTDENVTQINKYIEDSMTATTFLEDKSGKNNRKIVTSELIYYWMITLNIPPEYQKWHLNRLLTLIRVCNIENAPPKKTSKRELTSRYAAMNKARREQLKSKG